MSIGAIAHAAEHRSGLDLSTFDREVRPQDDLYRFVNGGWLDTVEIPSDRSRYGAFDMLAERAEGQVRAIIEAAAAAPRQPGSDTQKIGDLYASFMDEARIEKLGIRPIVVDLEAIDALDDPAQLAELLARLGRQGVSGAFGSYVGQDAKQSDRYTFYLGQGGLGLPDRDYYLQPRFEPERQAYRQHLEMMFGLAGSADPADAAARTFALEQRLAGGHWSRIDSRDRDRTYNKMARGELSGLAPTFGWERYLLALGADAVSDVVVAQPSYFEAFDAALREVPMATWRAWLQSQVLRAWAPYLSEEFVAAQFAFYGTQLSGTPELRPRWKRGVALVSGGRNDSLGEAVGRRYVELHFPPEAKQRMQVLVANLVEAYRQSILEIDWMGPETKTQALDKLAKFTTKIGYPERWRDYSALRIEAGDLVGNVRRIREFDTNRSLAKLGQPVDRDEWGMTPQTVNAYYRSTMNEIVFPAAILQPPFFDLEADDAVNYGGIGAVIGHEIGHGFDDQGSKSDGDGNLRTWWTEADRAGFEQRTAALIAQYDAFEPLPGQHVQGALSIGENIGDLAGLQIAYKAYRQSLAGNPAPVLDGFTGEQRLFLGWAQIWRASMRDEALRQQLTTGPHAPPEFRCNGVVRNLPEFHRAFGVEPGDGLYLPLEERVSIW
ncbi:MAG: M13 family metallopeptidase [Pseudomonadales bacterium]